MTKILAASRGLLLPLVAACAAGCMAEAQIGMVVNDVHAGANGMLFVERCALVRGPHRTVQMSDCDVEIVSRVTATERRRPHSPVDPRPGSAGPARPPEPGTLGIISFPPGATIEVDGRAAGTAPLIRRAIAPGDHHIQAVWPGGALATLDESVDPGKSTTARLFRP